MDVAAVPAVLTEGVLASWGKHAAQRQQRETLHRMGGQGGVGGWWEAGRVQIGMSGKRTASWRPG